MAGWRGRNIWAAERGRTGVFLQGVFGQPLLVAMLRAFLLIALLEPYVETREARATVSTG